MSLNSGLIFKWLKSENTSSAQSKEIARKTRQHLHITSKQYRKMLSYGREKTKVLERLMSDQAWDKIDFSKIPSKAGIIYRNAFARHDLERAKSEKNVQTYEEFAKDKTAKVNAKTLYPCDVVHEVTKNLSYWGRDSKMDETQRLMVQKYWDNLEDTTFKNAIFNGVAVVDTSGSMTGYGNEIAPIDVAIALGMYCSEKCNENSPWRGHYISFSRNARLIPIEGVDFYDKVKRIHDANLCENTNIESVFNLLLNLAIKNNIPQTEMPENIVIISDMEFDAARGYYGRGGNFETLMESIVRKWESCGYVCPKIVFWNVQARQDNIPMRDNGYVTFVSGYSAVLFEQILSGKTGVDFVLDKLDSPRYQVIH